MYHIAYGSASSVAMISILYGYINKVRNAPPYVWPLGSAAPLSARIMSFACLSLGLGLVGQLPPKIQIPVHFVSRVNNDWDDNIGDGDERSGGNQNNPSGKLLTNDNVAQSATATAATSMQEERAGGGGGWKVRCPFDFTDKRKIDATTTTDGNGKFDTPATVQLHGIERITRHPGLWSFGLIGLGHGLLVPSLPQKAFLCMPAMVALLGGSHSDSRHRRGLGGTLDSDYDKATSNIPFYAMLSGRQGSSDVAEVLSEFWMNEVKHSNAILAMGASALWVLMKGRGGGTIKKLPSR